MRIAIAAFSHETNTFAPEQNESMDSASIQRGEAMISRANPRSFIGGFVEGAKHPDVELVPTVGISFSRNGIIHADNCAPVMRSWVR